jgi:excisionase family DNA binding protein
MYVYALGDPRTQQIRYIGIAKDVFKRYAQHLNYPHPNDAKNAWMTEVKRAGIVPTLAILESGIEEDVVYEREKYWIQYYLALNAPLTNIIHNTQIVKITPKPAIEVKIEPVIEIPRKISAEKHGEDVNNESKKKDMNMKRLTQYLGVSEHTIFNLIKSGDLRGFKVGMEWKFEEEDIANFIQRQREKASQWQKEKAVQRLRYIEDRDVV